MPISETLELDISSALDAIESLNEPLTALGENLTITLSTAIESVSVEPLVEQLAALDASGLTTTIDAAVDSADGIVPIEAETDNVATEIDTAVSSADTTIELEADTSAFGGSIDEALNAADAVVPIEADATAVGPDIEAEIAGADATVTVDVDSAGLDEVSSNLEGISSGVDATAGSVSGLDASVAGAAGGFARFGSAGVLGIGLVTGAFVAVVNAGRDAAAAQQRFNSTLGKFADDARTINVGSLNTSLEDLAIRLGSDDEKALQATATLFQFAKAAGLSGKESAGFANNVQALAARAVALNPALGDTGDVAVALQNALARGQRATAKFNIALGTTEIVQRALKNTGKTLSADLSAQEKSFAGAQIAAERYGAGLETDITKGAKNAELQQRSLNEQLQDFIEAAGQPLVAPFQQLLKDLLPIARELIPIFGQLAEKLLPLLAEVISIIVPPLAQFVGLAADLIARVPAEAIAAIAAAFLAFKGFSIASDAVSKIKDIGTGFLDAGGKMKDFFKAGGGFDGLRLQAIGAKDRIADIGRQFATLATQLGKKIIATVQTKVVTGAAEGGAGAAGASGGGILAAIGKKLGLAKSPIAGVVGALSLPVAVVIAPFILSDITGVSFDEAFGGIGDEFTGTGGKLAGDLVQGFTDGINSGFTALGQFLVEFIPNQIITPIKNALGIGSPSTIFNQIGLDVMAGLLNGLVQGVVGVATFFVNLVPGILTIIGDVSRRLFGKGFELLVGFGEGVIAKAGEVLEFFRSIPGRVINAIGNVVSGAKSLFNRGADIVQGLINGVKSKVKSFLGTLTDLAKKGIRAVTHPWEAFSPSRVTIELGKNIGEGLVIGIKDQIPEVEAAAEALSNAIPTTIESPEFIPAALPIPGISKLPAVEAVRPTSAGVPATTAGFTATAQADAQGLGNGIHIEQLIVQTTAKDQTQVGIEVSRQLRAESFRAGR